MKNKNFIPIGEACSTATLLNQMGLRPKSLPFDWLASLTPKKLINLIQDDFKKFIPTEEELNLEYIRRQDLNNFFKKIDSKLRSPNKHYPNGSGPFYSFFNYEHDDKSQVKLKWEKYKKEAMEYGLENFDQFFEEFNFRQYSLDQIREELVYTNFYKIQCMHDFKSNEIVDGKINPTAYQRMVDEKTRRIDRLINFLNQDNFLAIHISDTFFLDEKNQRWKDLLKLSNLIKEKYSASNFKIISFNLLPYNHTEGNVTNFYNKWDLYKDSNQQQRDFMNLIIKNNYLD